MSGWETIVFWTVEILARLVLFINYLLHFKVVAMIFWIICMIVLCMTVYTLWKWAR